MWQCVITARAGASLAERTTVPSVASARQASCVTQTLWHAIVSNRQSVSLVFLQHSRSTFVLSVTSTAPRYRNEFLLWRTITFGSYIIGDDDSFCLTSLLISVMMSYYRLLLITISSLSLLFYPGVSVSFKDRYFFTCACVYSQLLISLIRIADISLPYVFGNLKWNITIFGADSCLVLYIIILMLLLQINIVVYSTLSSLLQVYKWIRYVCVCAVATAAACPAGCDKCQSDESNSIVCLSTGCSNSYFYASNGQCVGQLQECVYVSFVTVSLSQRITLGPLFSEAWVRTDQYSYLLAMVLDANISVGTSKSPFKPLCSRPCQWQNVLALTYGSVYVLYAYFWAFVCKIERYVEC